MDTYHRVISGPRRRPVPIAINSDSSTGSTEPYTSSSGSNTSGSPARDPSPPSGHRFGQTIPMNGHDPGFAGAGAGYIDPRNSQKVGRPEPQHPHNNAGHSPRSQSQMQAMEFGENPGFTDVPVDFSRCPRSAPPQNQDPRSRYAVHQPFGAPQTPRKASIVSISDKIVAMLDEIEKRVETLRDTASLLEDEKLKLLNMLKTMESNSDTLDVMPGEKEDIQATTSRLIARCRTVQVVVDTPRTASQQAALSMVNQFIDRIIDLSQTNADAATETCLGFLNACSPDQPNGPIDLKFQNVLIGCTADDQKKIRRSLEQVLTRIGQGNVA